MVHMIGPLFTAVELVALTEAVAALDWEDGRKTAGVQARKVKSNAQAKATPASDAVLRKVEASLMADAGFTSAARPKGFVRLIASRYEGGQAYGTHVDDAIMAGARTDLSFTLFLSDPASYAGGELVIVDRLEDRAVKLGPGEAVVYPSDTLHRVAPVTQGVRFAVVGWITSWVRDPARREILVDLDAAIADATTMDLARETLDRLLRTRSNLLRMWAE